jgi:hypothetical protein
MVACLPMVPKVGGSNPNPYHQNVFLIVFGILQFKQNNKNISYGFDTVLTFI